MAFLTAGERIQRKLKPSRRSPQVIKFYILGILTFLLGVSILFGLLPTPEIIIGGTDVVYNLSLIFVALLPVLFIYGELKRKWIGTYIITNFRIIVKRGLLRTNIDSVSNKMIVNVRAMQRFWERLLGIGNVDITTSRGEKEIELKDITNYKEIENLIYRMMERGYQQLPAGQQPQPKEQRRYRR